MSQIIAPYNQLFWPNEHTILPKLTNDIKTDIVIIGGGMAGLAAAQTAHALGASVTLIERNMCGAGASGKSSGFITPDSEISLTGLINRFGIKEAKKIWDFIVTGDTLIRYNIKKNELVCDYEEQDTLVVANSESTAHGLHAEHEHRKNMGYASEWYAKESLLSTLHSAHYYGGVCYPGTFSINPFRYCQQMKQVLASQGVAIYEETPALEIKGNYVKTPHGAINAQTIITCTDRFTPELGLLTDAVYQLQTFIMVSAPLSDQEISHIFPSKHHMVWDTDMVYSYYRLTPDNRLLVGGGSMLNSYQSHETFNSPYIRKKLSAYIKYHFPEINPLFTHMWPGLIGVSKDLMPIAGYNKDNSHLYHVSAATGLPWAAALGSYAAQAIIEKKNDFDAYFNPYRSFPIPGLVQSIIGKKAAFALSNLYTLKKYGH